MWPDRELNPRPPRSIPGALTTELYGPGYMAYLGGFDPRTNLRTSEVRCRDYTPQQMEAIWSNPGHQTFPQNGYWWKICWYWVFVHLLLPYVTLFSDYFSCFLSRLIRWFVAFVLHCFSLFALFVVLKFSSPVSLLFSLWHWAQGLYSVASLLF